MDEKLAGWFERFRYYRAPPSIAEIRDWLGRFSEADRPVAEKALDSIRLVSEVEVQKGYKEALESIPGWNSRRTKRSGKWVIAGFGGPGESGADMLRKFREANRLSGQVHDYLFAAVADLANLELTGHDTVVFVDDFAGTGDQISGLWPVHAELAGGARSFLILTAATIDAIERILDFEALEEVLVSHVIPRSDNIFSQDCTHFTDEEKNILLPYCKVADSKRPRGFGNCGLLFVLCHKTPNNSLPILYANKNSWRGLFPRFLNV